MHCEKLLLEVRVVCELKPPVLVLRLQGDNASITQQRQSTDLEPLAKLTDNLRVYGFLAISLDAHKQEKDLLNSSCGDRIHNQVLSTMP